MTSARFPKAASLAAMFLCAVCACSSNDGTAGYRQPGHPYDTSSTKGGGKADAGQGGAGATTPVDSGVLDPEQEACDGADNNHDGRVDEGCACAPGASQACYTGPLDTRHKGGCKDGTQQCTKAGEFGAWSTCTGSVLPGVEECGNKVDDDCDGDIDCADTDCPSCSENCKDGVDNDSDGQVDCMDGDCPPCTETNCGDGVDNDQDGTSDCADSDCPCWEDCNDGKDNDGNGKTDCADGKCANAPNCNCGPNGECCDGKDNNGDGRIDEGNVCQRVMEPCPPGAIQACDCYCGVHRKCRPDGTWGPCLVDGNYTCMPAVANQAACGILGMYCDFGLCAASMPQGNECVKHADCPMPLVCDLGLCVQDNYKPCL